MTGSVTVVSVAQIRHGEQWKDLNFRDTPEEALARIRAFRDQWAELDDKAGQPDEYRVVQRTITDKVVMDQALITATLAAQQAAEEQAAEQAERERAEAAEQARKERAEQAARAERAEQLERARAARQSAAPPPRRPVR
jgi:hypothetical protein